MGDGPPGTPGPDGGGRLTDADEAGRHERVGGERAPRWVDRRRVVEAEGLAEDQLLVGVGRVQLGHVDRSVSDTGHLGGLDGRGRDREVAGAESVGLHAVVDAGDPRRVVAGPCLGRLAGGEHDGGGAVGDGRQRVTAKGGDDVVVRQQLLDRAVVGHLGVGVGQRVLAAASGDHCEVVLGGLARVDEGAGLQGGEAHRVRPQRSDVVRIELQGEDLVEVAERRPAERVDEGGVDLSLLEEDPGLVQRPRPVHLDVALGPRRPDTDRVESHHEAERATDQVVGRARADEVDVVLGDSDGPEHIGDHRQQPLDLVVLVVAPHVLGLGKGGNRDRPDVALGTRGRAHRYSL